MQQLATRSPSFTDAPSVAERTTPPTSLPGTNGRSGLIWYSPRVCSTSGNDTPAACTSITTPLPGVSGCDGSGSGRSTCSRADSGPVRSAICTARMARERTSRGRTCARTHRVLAGRTWARTHRVLAVPQAAPEMDDGVGAEGAPALVVRLAAQPLEGAPDGHVAGQGRIAVAERAHGDVRDGPRPDPRYREEPGARLGRVRARIEAEL